MNSMLIFQKKADQITDDLRKEILSNPNDNWSAPLDKAIENLSLMLHDRENKDDPTFFDESVCLMLKYSILQLKALKAEAIN